MPRSGWRAWSTAIVGRPSRPSPRTRHGSPSSFSAATLLTHNTAVFFVLATNSFVLGLILYVRLQPVRLALACAPSFANWLKAQIGILILWLLAAGPVQQGAASTSTSGSLRPPGKALPGRCAPAERIGAHADKPVS